MTSARTTPALVNDERHAVPLETLSVGARFKMPDDPAIGVAGWTATLLRLGTGSAIVRRDGRTRCAFRPHNGDEEVAFERGAKAQPIALTSRVIPL